jgi:type IV secretion system protein TrbL
MSRRTAVLATVAVVALLMAADAAAQAPGVLDRMTLDYRSAYLGWVDRLLPIAQRTFVLLAGIEFGVAGALWMLRGDLDEMASGFILKFAFLAFWFALIFSFEWWVPPILDGFITAGRIGSGGSILSPSSVLDIGDRIFFEINDSVGGGSLVLNPVAVITALIAAVITALCFVGVAVMLSLVLIEAYLVLGAGVLFLGFAAWRATAGFAEGYLIYVAHVGIKVFVVHLIVGLGITLAQTWADYLRAAAGPFDMGPVWQVLAGSILFVVVTVTLPRSFAGGITGRVSLGLANAVRAGR